MGTIWSQSLFLPEPTLTEKNLPDQTGKVHIVTGGYTGIGFELAQILYAKNSTVYIAGRSSSKGTAAISALKAACPHSQGRLEFLSLDLADLPTISKSAAEFMSKETRLDVLTNNAGVMVPPAGSTTAQGFELQMGTNCLGPFLFTLCLLPVLKKTARTAAPGSVRVTWAGSLGVEVFAPKGGVEFDEKSGAPKVLGSRLDYGQSKVGNVLIASEFAKRFSGDGIITVCFNPGNLKSELQRHGSRAQKFFADFLLYPPIYGGYTELYSGWSSDITAAQNGSYIWPWGRPGTLRKELVNAMKSKSEGGNGKAEQFWLWCEKETKPYI